MAPYSPQARALFDQMMAVMQLHMTAEEDAGRAYLEAAIDVSGIIGELLVKVLSVIDDDAARTKIVSLFCHHLPPAVKKARSRVVGHFPIAGGMVQ